MFQRFFGAQRIFLGHILSGFRGGNIFGTSFKGFSGREYFWDVFLAVFGERIFLGQVLSSFQGQNIFGTSFERFSGREYVKQFSGREPESADDLLLPMHCLPTSSADLYSDPYSDRYSEKRISSPWSDQLFWSQPSLFWKEDHQFDLICQVFRSQTQLFRSEPLASWNFCTISLLSFVTFAVCEYWTYMESSFSCETWNLSESYTLAFFSVSNFWGKSSTVKGEERKCKSWFTTQHSSWEGQLCVGVSLELREGVSFRVRQLTRKSRVICHSGCLSCIRLSGFRSP